MARLLTWVVATVALATAAGAAAQSTRTVPRDTAATTQRAVELTQTAVTELTASCDGGERASCAALTEVQALRRRMYGLFEACAGGDAASCEQHDAEAARIVEQANARVGADSATDGSRGK